MIVNKIILHNFRNYDSETIAFEPNVNFILGKNAQGKTNIIETIYYGSYGKSFRDANDQHIIKHNQTNMYFGIEFKTMYGSKKIEVKINNSKKKEVKINNTPITKTSELIGELCVIIFSPDDLKIIKEGPAARRRFIDRQISLIDSNYYRQLIEYNKVMNQRNNYLKMTEAGKHDPLLIETYDEKLAEYGTRIIKKRHQFTEMINAKSSEIHKVITDQKESLEMKYVSSIMSTNDMNYDKIEERYKVVMKENFNRDVRYQYTNYGPHRDEFIILSNEQNLKIFGSQGQIRTAILSLILSVLMITVDEIGENPILLLDDVFSELDQKRRHLLISYIGNIQTFITATDLSGIDIELFKKYSKYIVESGKIRRF
jgi:DNA replication and repair protein RecF